MKSANGFDSIQLSAVYFREWLHERPTLTISSLFHLLMSYLNRVQGWLWVSTLTYVLMWYDSALSTRLNLTYTTSVTCLLYIERIPFTSHKLEHVFFTRVLFTHVHVFFTRSVRVHNHKNLWGNKFSQLSFHAVEQVPRKGNWWLWSR